MLNLLFALSLLSVGIIKAYRPHDPHHDDPQQRIVEQAISVILPNENEIFPDQYMVDDQYMDDHHRPSHRNMVRGTVTFEMSVPAYKTRIYGEISGLPKKSKFGFHVHDLGNISVNCESTGPHYDPFETKKHGGPNDEEGHVGDLGNIISDKDGVARFEFFNSMIQLNGDNNVIGRALVIHEKEDDLKTNPTGASGDRLACGVIGIAKENNVYYTTTPSPVYHDYTPSPTKHHEYTPKPTKHDEWPTPYPVYHDYTESPTKHHQYTPSPTKHDEYKKNDHYQNSCISFVINRGSRNQEIRFLVDGPQLMDVFAFGCPRWEIRPAFGFGCDGECFSIKYMDNNKFLSNDIDVFNFNLSPKVKNDKELWYIESGSHKQLRFINKESDELLCVSSIVTGNLEMVAFDTGNCEWDINELA